MLRKLHYFFREIENTACIVCVLRKYGLPPLIFVLSILLSPESVFYYSAYVCGAAALSSPPPKILAHLK